MQYAVQKRIGEFFVKKAVVILIILSFLPVFGKTITGEIKKETKAGTNRIYDAYNNNPIEGAVVKLPAKNFSTVTNKDGAFELGTSINGPTIMSVEKSGYKPFSLTLNSNPSSPVILGIEKTTPQDLIVETDMIHLGDNSFSTNSANAYDFSLSAEGAFYSKDLPIKHIKNDENLYLVIGSIIGLDTLQSQRLGQSRVRTAYSSPAEIFCNGSKIAEIKINGDNQKINIPKALIAGKNLINITIKTGRNLYKTSAIDFDDIEFTNLLLEIK